MLKFCDHRGVSDPKTESSGTGERGDGRVIMGNSGLGNTREVAWPGQECPHAYHAGASSSIKSTDSTACSLVGPGPSSTT